MAIFKVEGGRRLRGEITPQGAKNEALADPLRHAAHATEEVIVHNVPQILDVIQLIESAAGDGRRSGAACPKRAIRSELRDIDLGLPATRTTTAAAASRLRGSVMLLGSDAGAFRRGLHAQAGRRQDRPPQARHPLHRLSEAGRHARFRHCRAALLRSPTARSCKGCYMLLDEAFGDRHGQHHHGGRDGQGFRRPSTTPPASPTCSSCAGCSTAWAHAYRASPRTCSRSKGVRGAATAPNTRCCPT